MAHGTKDGRSDIGIQYELSSVQGAIDTHISISKTQS
jgi:hypothetical protein